MKLIIKSLALSITMALLPSLTMAYDFQADGFAFNKNSGDTTVTVTWLNSIFDDYPWAKVQELSSRPAYSNLGSRVVIPSSVTYGGKTYTVTGIGWLAFYNVSNMVEVIIPNSVRDIAGGTFSAFRGCSSLTTISIPGSAVNIGTAFDDTQWYNDQPDGMVYVGQVAYRYKGTMPYDSSITLREGTKGIASSCFYNCNLKDITIPRSVRAIGENAFYYCTRLTSLTLPDSIVYIGGGAIGGCSNLTLIVSKIPKPHNVVNGGGLGWPFSYSTCKLLVPHGSINLYRFHWVWREFSNIEEFYETGDVNLDGDIDARDINELINIILTPIQGEDDFPESADVNGDGAVDASDVSWIINYIMSEH